MEANDEEQSVLLDQEPGTPHSETANSGGKLELATSIFQFYTADMPLCMVLEVHTITDVVKTLERHFYGLPRRSKYGQHTVLVYNLQGKPVMPFHCIRKNRSSNFYKFLGCIEAGKFKGVAVSLFNYR